MLDDKRMDVMNWPKLRLAIPWVPVGIALISLVISAVAICQTSQFQSQQWEREDLGPKRDVLRRFVTYRYRLTEGLSGTDGEPFVALNEAWVVFADSPEVTKELEILHKELGREGRLPDNIVALVRAMASASGVPLQKFDDEFIKRPFTPPTNPN